MNLLENLERKLRRYAVHNVTLYLILGQVLFFVFALSGRFILQRVVLIPDLVMAGEWWRLITFLFIPPVTNPIFAFFAWYMFYLMGSALEDHWGAFRYNFFLLVGYVVTVAVSFTHAPLSGNERIYRRVCVSGIRLPVSGFSALDLLYPPGKDQVACFAHVDRLCL